MSFSALCMYFVIRKHSSFDITDMYCIINVLRLMLWSEIGSTPQIKQSGMDGSERKVVVSHSLSWPVSLAYDLLDNRVYWADEKLRCIGSASLDGGNIKVFECQTAKQVEPRNIRKGKHMMWCLRCL